MSLPHIVALLTEERDRIQTAIDALKGTHEPEPHNVPDWVLPKPKAEPRAPRKRTISAASRRRMAEGQRKRWENVNATKTESAPKKKTARAIVAEVIAPPEDAEFKSKMSIAMAKSWAKRRAAAPKKVARK